MNESDLGAVGSEFGPGSVASNAAAMRWLRESGSEVPSRQLTPGSSLTVRPVLAEVTADGPRPLEVRREAGLSREELLLPLGDKERMLVVAIAEALKVLEPEGEAKRAAAVPLLAAFRGATGASFVEAAWT